MKARSARVKQILQFGIIMTMVSCVIMVAVTGSQLLPGSVGKWFAFVVGLVTTPVLLEISLCVVGFVLVLLYNIRKRRREGDEFVWMDVEKGDSSDRKDD